MAYVSLYRAYRPQDFKEVSGQEHVVKTLKNAVVSNKVSHAYLFSGPRGTGKTSIAKILAKAVNCLNPTDGNPCNKCSICVSINENKTSDIIEMDAASNNGINDIRELKDKVRYLPSECKYKVYIIDEVHALSTDAYNGFLKTLEEPPGYVIFILATTEPHSIPQTILSRTQRFDFKGLDQSDIENRIKFICKEEKIKIDDESVHSIATLADGGMRDALSLLDQSISYSSDKVTIEQVNKISGSVGTDLLIDLAASINECDTSNSLVIIDKLLKDGKEINRILTDLVNFYRDILLYKNNHLNNDILFKNAKFIEVATRIPNNQIYFYVQNLADTQINIKKTNQKRAYLEMSIIKMSDKQENTNFDVLNKINALTKRINELEANGVKHTIIDTSSTATETKTVLDEKEFIQIEDIEDILNNPNKDAKLKVTDYLQTLKGGSTKLSKALDKMNICAYGNSNILFSHDSVGICDSLMQLEIKEDFLKQLNSNCTTVNNYFVITTKQWKLIFDDFKSKYSKENTKPKLNKIEINIKNYTKRSDPFEPELIRKAKEFFPNEIIEIEE